MSRPTPAAAPLASPFEHPQRLALALCQVAVLLLPAGRGYSQALGWLPLWLVAMPLSAWWALHGFALPRWPAAASGVIVRRRRRGPQARRRRADRAVAPLSRAA